MIFDNLQDFVKFLESKQHLKRITHPVKSDLEITEISKRFLEQDGPALLFEQVIRDDDSISKLPVLTNLYANVDRIAFGLGLESRSQLKELGKVLAYLKHPTPPDSLKSTLQMFPMLKRILAMSPKIVTHPPCQELIFREPDLTKLPIQRCWPLDVSPLITWPIIVTKDFGKGELSNYNLGIYRLQRVSKNKLIMRWLKMRGGLSHYKNCHAGGNKTFPAAAVIGASPAVTLAASMPLPENISEYNFAGLLNSKKIELAHCVTIDLKVPADAEIVLEGEVSFDEFLPEGPFGDHTGYYNDVEYFPVFNIKAITMKRKPIYISTYTGKPPDEPSIIGVAFNEIFLPIIQLQFPEIVDFWLPQEGCSYRFAVISIKKSYPGHAKRIMMGIWSYLKQFIYTKFLIIVDDDINVKDWSDVIWAISTRSDPHRDSTIINNTPIDYLDFASPSSGLGGKIGIDATNKIPPETNRNWGQKITMRQDVINKIDSIWDSLF